MFWFLLSNSRYKGFERQVSRMEVYVHTTALDLYDKGTANATKSLLELLILPPINGKVSV